ncbi:saccharopine dehydrogenase NADP-binding domain-containing protein [bacterium]|nr:saccharopine dehydrogenase NADP-binding domain-containing protein [bacterium]
MKILVLGAGLMGRAVVFDMLRNPKLEELLVADHDAKQLKETEALINNPNELRITYKKLDIDDDKEVAKLMRGCDTVVSAVTYKYNFKLAKLAITNGCNFCDLGGNNTIVNQELELHEKAKKKLVTIVPDCGLAPGMVSVLVAHGMAKMDETDNVKIRVGGLPVDPKPPMNYKLVFSVHGLINEYVESCVKIRDGKIIEEAPLIDVEELEFPAPFGKLEAFNTSGGTSTLPQTYKGKVKNLDYKTIRYPGHCAQFKLLMDLGLMDSKPHKVGDAKVAPRELLSGLLMDKLTMEGKDCVLVRVVVEGKKNGTPRRIQYQIIDYGDAANNVTAMMRLTSYPISVIAQMMSAGEITEKGAIPQELCVPAEKFIQELKKRNIGIEITEA